MRARLKYLALSPTTPRRVAQWTAELAVLLLAVVVLLGAFQLPALAVLALGGTVSA
jgi:hypothetical protein